MLISAFDYRWYVGAIAVTGIVLSAVYMLWAYQRIMTGPDVPEGDTRDLDRREVIALAPLMVGLVLFGFYPAPLLDVGQPDRLPAARPVGRPGRRARRTDRLGEPRGR